jgi:prophage regulatory protein
MQTYLTLTELRAKLGNRSRSAVYADLAAGRLPPPLKLGGRVYWPETEVDAFLRDLRAGDHSASGSPSPSERTLDGECDG